MSIVADQAIAWFTQEVERLRQAQPTEGDTDEWTKRIAALEAENAKLKSDRDLAVSKLNQFRSLLDQDSVGEVAPAPDPQIDLQAVPVETRSSHTHQEGLDPDVLRALDAIINYNNSR